MDLGGTGTQTAGLAFGGATLPGLLTSNRRIRMDLHGQQEEVLNTARQYLAGCGTQTAALAFGGATTSYRSNRIYNGTTWTTSANSMGTARRGVGGTGTQTAGLGFGGNFRIYSAATEEFTDPSFRSTKNNNIIT
jgi:hypothetical protein